MGLLCPLPQFLGPVAQLQLFLDAPSLQDLFRLLHFIRWPPSRTQLAPGLPHGRMVFGQSVQIAWTNKSIPMNKRSLSGLVAHIPSRFMPRGWPRFPGPDPPKAGPDRGSSSPEFSLASCKSTLVLSLQRW